jgi:outer membrane protein assembly factor BamE (lipoprotein component of BamABCDE complex)
MRATRRTRTSPFRAASRAVLAGVVTVALSGCVPIYRNHGYVPPAEELAEITVGVDTRDSVIESVGAPSTSGMLADGDLFYVSTWLRYRGMLEPRVVDRQLVAITFDNSGVVRNIERFTLEDGRVIPLERRVTSSGVENTGFLRQLLGNIGQFDPGTFLDN